MSDIEVLHKSGIEVHNIHLDIVQPIHRVCDLAVRLQIARYGHGRRWWSMNDLVWTLNGRCVRLKAYKQHRVCPAALARIIFLSLVSAIWG